MFTTSPLSLVLLLVSSCLPTVLSAPNCPPQGPVFEKPRNFATSAAIRSALANLTATFAARDKDNSPSVLSNETSYSIQVFSTGPNTPNVFEWHHTAELMTSRLNASSPGVKKAGPDTVYRLGSLTKVFTVYTWLAQDGDQKWNEPITKYVPELAAAAKQGNAKSDGVRYVDWDEVTVGALASQMGGIIRDYGLMGEVTQQMDAAAAVALGFPPLKYEDPTVPKCGVWPLCNRTEFFNGLLQTYPSYAPWTTPAYTNTGYQILAYALEAIKGRKFEDMMKDSIFKPLGLTHTYYNGAPASAGIIPGPELESQWYFQLGDEDPAGGMYSSIADISALGRSILSSSLLTPATTRRWLKPAAMSSEPNAGVGAPWGVRRISLSSQANGKRTIDAFNKAGRIGYYSSLLILLPDYDIGISALIAGPTIPGNTNFNLADIIGNRLLPALEEAGREQASSLYGGVYSDPARNASLRITTQSDRPGLGIENWISNGTYMQYISVALQSGYQPVDPTVRLYPTGLETVLTPEKDGRKGKRVGYKAVFEDKNLPARNPADGSMFSTDCGTWVSFTGVSYGTFALDQFVFELDEAGRVRGLENMALRVVLKKEGSGGKRTVRRTLQA
ncbi:D-alanyl-D-alanine-carboxypeptidase/endopeptidase AmpH [Rhypophila decipiens]|uniref:D-alanyl-D-alanine-carboxypeptidase/endopeptidase AmpH n=1 Tax=Rhypophila decipiens TaxID=261697 RepID=A0AAN6YJ93_9PEZI|nr:D-alanyl-D-alanine-carboxypeptidase/endopeptidase AmpH [Rhypophila decipiens]